MLLPDLTVILPMEPSSRRRQTLLHSAIPLHSICLKTALHTSPTTAQATLRNNLLPMGHSQFLATAASTVHLHMVVRLEMAFALMTAIAVTALPRTRIAAWRTALPIAAGLDRLQPALATAFAAA